MENKSQEFPKTIYWLESVDTEKRTGVLKIKPESPVNAPWKTIHVAITGLLAYRIANKDYRGLVRPQEFVGTRFVSTVHSPEFKENPFKLTHFIPDEGSDMPEHYELGLVTERVSPKETLTDAVGNQISVIRKWKRTKSKFFLRYYVVKVKKMMSEISGNVVIVDPFPG